MNSELDELIDDLSRSIRIQFGLPPNKPSADELLNILADINRFTVENRTSILWREVISKHVPGVGTYFYKGLDYSDLNLLLARIIACLSHNNSTAKGIQDDGRAKGR